MTPLAAFALAGCLAVNPASDRIVAADLVPGFPGLASAAPDAEIALAPAPGVPRVFRPVDLRRLAARFDLPSAPEREICIERPVAPPNRAAVLAAMHRIFPEARIDIVELSRQPVPAGEIEFPAAGLHTGLAGEIWNGSVRYAGTRRFLIWARVGVLATVRRVVAAAALQSGQPIPAGELRAETREEFPDPRAFAESLDQVAGKWLRFPVHAGEAIRLDQVLPPREILKGDTVHVEVRSGAARLQMDAQAEADGALGEIIPISNPVSKKRFRARVEGKGRVAVDSAATMENR